MTEAESRALLDRTVENQKRDDRALDLFERIERTETRKDADVTKHAEVRVVRTFPAGAGTAHILLGPDGKPADAAAYRKELEKLEQYLAWAAQSGSEQRTAYEKVAKKRKEREDLVEATRLAFLYTWVADEPRGDRMLSKYRMEPNPAYKPTSRSTGIFAKVRGYVWLDAAAAQLARVDAQVTDDISFGGFLAKIYKGSHFMQERYELEPGIWLPTFSQYDFDGRKFFFSFGIHERTFFTQYRRVGPPKDAVAIIRAELGKPAASAGDP